MVFSACRIWTLFTCYLHMYMSSIHYLGICVLCTHYLQWSLIYPFLTDNADVIHMSSLVLFIYPIMYNLVSAHCLHKCTLSMSFACCLHICTHHLLVIFTTPHIPYYPELSFRTLSTHMHIVDNMQMTCTYANNSSRDDMYIHMHN